MDPGRRCDADGGGAARGHPAQAAEGALRERLRREAEGEGSTARQAVRGLADAAACGLPELADARLAQLAELLPGCAGLPELLDALGLLDRLAAGHVAGLDLCAERSEALGATAAVLTAAAVRQLDGLGGSEDPADARALLELARRADDFGGLRLGDALARLAAGGTPLIRGAAGAVRVLLGQEPPGAFGDRAASWVDGATDPGARRTLARALTGLLTAAESLLATAPAVLAPLLERIAALPDSAFLDRLPALRGGFDTLSPAARDRLLALVEERLGERVDALPQALDPALLAAWTGADLAARRALLRRGLFTEPVGPAAGAADPTPAAPHPAVPDVAAPHPAAPGVAAPAPVVPPPPTGAARASVLPPADRWRLLLGRPGSRGPTGRSARLATALDELYGTGRGEGSGPGGAGRGGGREAPYPGVREWSEELTALFGPGIREEVLAAAVEHGRGDVLDVIDPGAVRPSVDLLRTVLEHAGGLPEAASRRCARWCGAWWRS